MVRHPEYIGRLARSLMILVAGAFGVAATLAAAAAPVSQVTFDDFTAGPLPQHWTIAATNPRGQLAHWAVVADPGAKSPPNVLSLTEIGDRSGGHFNLVWTPDLSFHNGEIDVAVRANAGRKDQGGGPMWRVRDADNYYVARYNPLENNFRIYYVKNGWSYELASAENIPIAAGQWLTIRIVHRGSHIEGWVDGQKLLELDDTTFPDEGAVGLWTRPMRRPPSTIFRSAATRSSFRAAP